MIYRICSECGSEQGLSTSQPINLSCQQCGSPYSRFSKKVHLLCSCCPLDNQEMIIIPADEVHFSICPKCNKNAWQLTTAKGEVRSGEEVVSAGLKKLEPGLLKIAIPYFEGNDLVERAVKTWVIPEVVFFLNDPLVIPPGSGVCSQIFLKRDGNSLLQKKKESMRLPIVNDIFKELIKNFPDCEFYGYFNSDIILPPQDM